MQYSTARDTRHRKSTRPRVDLTGLRPCAQYEVSVRARWPEGEDWGDYVTITAVTKLGTPEGKDPTTLSHRGHGFYMKILVSLACQQD